jgi:hypothetical protein
MRELTQPGAIERRKWAITLLARLPNVFSKQDAFGVFIHHRHAYRDYGVTLPNLPDAIIKELVEDGILRKSIMHPITNIASGSRRNYYYWVDEESYDGI